MVTHGSALEGRGGRWLLGRSWIGSARLIGMGVHLVIIAKMKLLAGGHSNCQILASLLCPFALKLPFVAARLPNSCAELAVSLRFFVFRLGRIFLQRLVGRWERALRLLHDRVATSEERRRVLGPSDEMLTQISMLTL